MTVRSSCASACGGRQDPAYRPVIAPLFPFMRLRPGRLVALLALAGCGPRVATAPPPAAPPTPTPEPATPAPTTTAPAATRFAFLPGAASYDVRSESTVEMTSGP